MLWRRGKAYSQDLRERVFAAADDGEPVGRIASLLRVSVSYVNRLGIFGGASVCGRPCYPINKITGGWGRPWPSRF